MDAALGGHLLAQERVDHSVAGGLHLGLESVRGDYESGRESKFVSINPSGLRDGLAAGPQVSLYYV
jgi:hypothetical protein